MIVIDTHVLSEMMRDEPDHNVLAWTDQVARLHTTAVTLAEIEYGIARLRAGRRKDRLAAMATRVFTAFGKVILPFDAGAAGEYANIVVGRERAGRPITVADAQIAAICASHGATLATRNTDDFHSIGIELINPWHG